MLNGPFYYQGFAAFNFIQLLTTGTERGAIAAPTKC